MKAMRQLVAAACTCGVLSGVTAMAAAPTEDFEVRVQYGDLDIERTDGAKVLYDRLHYASQRACAVRSYREIGSLRRVRDARACYDDLMDDLVAKIDSGALRALHSG